MITINIDKQILIHSKKIYSISTAKKGVGEIYGSNCTPRGKFIISEKIGANLELGSVLVGRKYTGEIYNTGLSKIYPNRDWILSRIIWLDGVEEFNKNTKNRLIYIHGSPDEIPMGVPSSKGCIRMRNVDVIELFEQIMIFEKIHIIES